MAPTYRIRDIRRSDIDALVDLCADHAAYERSVYHRDGKKTRLHELLFGKPGRPFGFVVEGPNGLVGYATYTVQWSTWEAGP